MMRKTNKSVGMVIAGMLDGKQVASIHNTHRTLEQYRRHVQNKLNSLGVKVSYGAAGNEFRHDSGGSIRFVVVESALSGRQFSLMCYDDKPMSKETEDWVLHSHCRLTPDGEYKTFGDNIDE